MYAVYFVSKRPDGYAELETALPWSALGCRLVGPLPDAAALAARMQTRLPEIVMIDYSIEMPETAQLMNLISLAGGEPRVIFLTEQSGQSAPAMTAPQQALRCLVQPLQPQTLVDTVLHAINALHEVSAADIPAAQAPGPDADQLREDFIRQTAMFGYYDTQKFSALLSVLSLESTYYRLAILDTGRSAQPGYHQLLTKQAIHRRLPELFPAGCGVRLHLADYQLGSFLLLLCYDAQPPQLQEGLEALCQTLESACGAMSVGISGQISSFADVTAALLQAQHALELKFYAERGLVFLYDGIQLTFPAKEIVIDVYFEKILCSVRECDPDTFLRLVDELTAMARARWQGVAGGVDECRKLFIELATLLLGELQTSALRSNKVVSSSLPYIPILYADGIGSIRLIVADLGLQIIKQMQIMRTMQGDYTISTIIKFLSEHYASEITLNQVAQLVYMNPCYVSRLLKKATGKTFTDLLLEVRLDKAKELLLHSNTKVYQIADMVGIENSKYFSQVFRKTTGLTPSEYRNSGGANG